MSNNVAVEFAVGQTNNIEAGFSVEQSQAINTEFTIDVAPKKVSQLENDLDFQTKEEVDTALEAKQDVLIAGDGITIEDNVISATATSAEWGLITGDIDDQTDLKNALDAKYDASNPDGYTSNVGTVTSVNNVSPDDDGNVTLSIPTDTSDLTNGAGFITGITSGDVTTALGYTPLSPSDIADSVDSSSTNLETVGAKLFYDTCGDIEATLNAIRGV